MFYLLYIKASSYQAVNEEQDLEEKLLQEGLTRSMEQVSVLEMIFSLFSAQKIENAYDN